MSVGSPPEERFNRSLYDMLLSEDRSIIDEYIPKMTPGEVNSFMKRLIEHYETDDETLEVNEDLDSILVFENNNISAISEFVDKFISSTHSSFEINSFFRNSKNFDFVVRHPQFYKNNSPAFLHIFKNFNLRRSLRMLLEEKDELKGLVWEGLNSYFENKKENYVDIFAYLGSFISRKLRQELDIGFICPFCSSYYTRLNTSKKSLIKCNNCHKRFVFVSVKCPSGCGKFVPISNIDKEKFDKNLTRHIRAVRALNKYIDKDGMRYITEDLGLDYGDLTDEYKITISAELQKRKIKTLPEYQLDEDVATSVPEYLFYLPLVCPITTGITRMKPTYRQRQDIFMGCGNSFILKDGLRKVEANGYSVYKTYDQYKIKYVDYNKNSAYYDEHIYSYNQDCETAPAKLPFDRLIKIIDEYFVEDRLAKNKSAMFLSMAFKKYFEEEYLKNVSTVIDAYSTQARNLPDEDIKYVMSFQNYLNDKQLQNNLYYKNLNNKTIIGWLPTNEAKDRIREIYVELACEEENLVRKVNANLPLRFYTYRISKIHGRQTTYRKRIGIAIDKTVLPATKRSMAGYGQNFKMDKKFIKIRFKDFDLAPYVKGGAYWMPENAVLHGFDNKTGIIWFEGKEVEDQKWMFPNDLIVEENTNVCVDLICTTDAFSKMFQRFDFSKKLKDLVFELELRNDI